MPGAYCVLGVNLSTRNNEHEVGNAIVRMGIGRSSPNGQLLLHFQEIGKELARHVGGQSC